VDQIKINLVEPEGLQARFNGRLESLRTVVIIPEFGTDKEIFALEGSPLQTRLESFSHGSFIAIALSAIEVAKPGLKRRLGRSNVSCRSGMSVPKPRAGICPPLFNGIFLLESSPGVFICTPSL
jgi:hypothetical protein